MGLNARRPEVARPGGWSLGRTAGPGPGETHASGPSSGLRDVPFDCRYRLVGPDRPES